MFSIRLLLEAVLLLARAIVEALREAPDFRALECRIVAAVQEVARRLFEHACAYLDEQALRARDAARLQPVHTKAKKLQTVFGALYLRRRYYRDRQTGAGRYVLDELLGLEPRQRLSPLVWERGVLQATERSFRGAARALEALTGGTVHVSAMGLWRRLQAVGAGLKARTSARREALFGYGEVPPGRAVPEALHVEADEFFVPGRGGAVGIKLAAGYEGKEPVGRGRRRLVNRRVHAAVADGATFFEEAVAEFGQVWDLGAVGACWVGSDGAPWAKRGLMEAFPRATFRLDPFHLRRALREGLGHDAAAHAAVQSALAAGRSWAEVAAVLEEAAAWASGERRRRVQALVGYLRAHWDGIEACEGVRRLGVIEGTGRHVLMRRMKRIGGCWSRQGADHMARVLAAKANGELEAVLRQVRPRDVARCAALVPERPVRPCTAEERQDLEAWLRRVRVPALYGPSAGRAWVKYVLRELVRIASVA